MLDTDVVQLFRSSHVPPESWGEAYLTFARIVPRFKPELNIPFERFFRMAWKRRRIDIVRREQSPRRGGKLKLFQEGEAGEPVGRLDDNPAKSGRDPVEVEDAATNMQRAIARLSPAKREALILSITHGYKRAAAEMGIPLGMFKSRLSRVYEELREVADANG